MPPTVLRFPGRGNLLGANGHFSQDIENKITANLRTAYGIPELQVVFSARQILVNERNTAPPNAEENIVYDYSVDLRRAGPDLVAKAELFTNGDEGEPLSENQRADLEGAFESAFAQAGGKRRKTRRRGKKRSTRKKLRR